jgi:hypothetical protein
MKPRSGLRILFNAIRHLRGTRNLKDDSAANTAYEILLRAYLQIWLVCTEGEL